MRTSRKLRRAPVRVRIRPAASAAELEWCATLMASSEPWLTLGRSYDVALQLLRRPTHEVVVAERAGTLLGFLILTMQGPFPGYVQTVAVDPAHRGQGIGTRLIRWAEERIFRESPNVFLCVSSFNPDALRLYRRLGYDAVGELPDYLVPGHAEILLRKSRGPWASFQTPRTGRRKRRSE